MELNKIKKLDRGGILSEHLHLYFLLVTFSYKIRLISNLR
jgi:hypothetical protein